jgi:prepilin peptidase dependent protein B
MLSPRQKQQGLTLVELMVASSIALIALAAILTAYGATVHHSTAYLDRAHLHQQLHTLMHAMVRDIRRAGYWRFDPGTRPASDNPFATGDNRLRTDAYPGEAPDSCIVFAYDLDKDGRVGVGSCTGGACAPPRDADNVEQFGFRLRDGRAQARYAGRTLSCDSGYWQALTDPDIHISRLTFAEHAVCFNLDDPNAGCTAHAARLVRRRLEIRLSGHQRAQPEAPVTLSAWVRVRNDLFRGAS